MTTPRKSETGRTPRSRPRKKVEGSHVRSADEYYASGQVDPVSKQQQDHKSTKKATIGPEFGQDFDNDRTANKYYATRTPKPVKPKAVPKSQRPVRKATSSTSESIIQFKDVECVSQEQLKGLVERSKRYTDRGYRVHVQTTESFRGEIEAFLSAAVDRREMSTSQLRMVVLCVPPVDVQEQGVVMTTAESSSLRQLFAEMEDEDHRDEVESAAQEVAEVDLDAILASGDVEARLESMEDLDRELPADPEEDEDEDDEY